MNSILELLKAVLVELYCNITFELPKEQPESVVLNPNHRNVLHV